VLQIIIVEGTYYLSADFVGIKFSRHDLKVFAPSLFP